MPFIVAHAILTHNLPARVVVARTGNGRVRILPRKSGTKLLKEKIVDADFDKLLDKGAIEFRKDLPDDMKGNYPEPAKAPEVAVEATA
jgi:hypothetical protein